MTIGNPFELSQQQVGPPETGTLTEQDLMLMQQAQGAQLAQATGPGTQGGLTEQDMLLLQSLSENATPHLIDKALKQVQEQAESEERQGRMASKVKNVIKNISDLRELAREERISGGVL